MSRGLLVHNDTTVHLEGSSRWKRMAVKYGIDAPLVLLMLKYVIEYRFGIFPCSIQLDRKEIAYHSG